jgi:shikimate kinase
MGFFLMPTAPANSTPDKNYTLPARIVLTGFMGSGKTTVGKLLANHMGWEFLDLDDVIIQAQGQSISTLFAEHGEPAFRQCEHQALKSVVGKTRLVLALGGGALETRENLELLLADPGTCLIFLEAPLDLLLERCQLQAKEQGNAIRPLLADPMLLERYARRLPLYRAAHHTFTTVHQKPTETLQKILRTLSCDKNSDSTS